MTVAFIGFDYQVFHLGKVYLHSLGEHPQLLGHCFAMRPIAMRLFAEHPIAMRLFAEHPFAEH
jgi:hypothetical protein